MHGEKQPGEKVIEATEEKEEVIDKPPMKENDKPLTERVMGYFAADRGWYDNLDKGHKNSGSAPEPEPESEPAQAPPPTSEPEEAFADLVVEDESDDPPQAPVPAARPRGYNTTGTPTAQEDVVRAFNEKTEDHAGMNVGDTGQTNNPDEPRQFIPVDNQPYFTPKHTEPTSTSPTIDETKMDRSIKHIDPYLMAYATAQSLAGTLGTSVLSKSMGVNPALGLGAFAYFQNVFSDPEYSQKIGNEYGANLANMAMGRYSAATDPASFTNNLTPFSADKQRINPQVAAAFSGNKNVPGTDQVEMIQRDVMSYLQDISAPYPL